MNPLRSTLIAFAALALLAPARAQEKTESTLVIDIPAAVQATIQKEKGDGKVVEFRRANQREIGLQQEGSTVQTQRGMIIALGQFKKGRQIRAIDHHDEDERSDDASQDHAHICRPSGRSIHDSGTSPQHNRQADRGDWFIWFIRFVLFVWLV